MTHDGIWGKLPKLSETKVMSQDYLDPALLPSKYSGNRLPLMLFAMSNNLALSDIKDIALETWLKHRKKTL